MLGRKHRHAWISFHEEMHGPHPTLSWELRTFQRMHVLCCVFIHLSKPHSVCSLHALKTQRSLQNLKNAFEFRKCVPSLLEVWKFCVCVRGQPGKVSKLSLERKSADRSSRHFLCCSVLKSGGNKPFYVPTFLSTQGKKIQFENALLSPFHL